MKSAETYTAIYLHRQTQYHAWHSQIAQWEKDYWLQHYDDADVANQTTRETGVTYQHIDSAPADYVNQLLGTVTAPRVIRTIQSDDQNSDKAQDIADRAEKFIEGAWQMNRARQITDPLRAVYFQQLVRSAAFVQVYMDDDRLALYKKAKGIPRDAYFPICIEWLNPLCCFPDPVAGRWSWTDQFIRAEKMTPLEVAAIWGEDETKAVLDDPAYFDEDNQSVDEAGIDYLDVWEWEMKEKEPHLMNGVVYNGKWLVEPRDMSDKYRDMPVLLIPAWDLPAPEIERRYQSPLQPMMQSVRTQERIVNRVMTSAAFTANPILKARGMRLVDISNHPGAIIPTEQDQDVNYLMGVSVPPILLNIFQLVQAALNRSSLSPAHFGDAPPTWSGFMLNQAILASSVKTQPIIVNLCRGLSMIDQRILDLVAAYFPDNDIAAYGNRSGIPFTAKIKGSEVEGLRVVTNLTPDSPTDAQARFGLAAMARQAPMPGGDPLLPDSMIQTDILNVEDVTALRQAIFKQKLMQLPSLQKWSMLAALKTSKDFPQDIIKAAAQELEQQLGMAQQQAGGPPGMPPQGAPPGAAQPGAAPGQPAPGAVPPVQEIISAIDEAVAAGGISQEVADQAKQRLQSGEDPRAVMEWLRQQIMQSPQGQAAAQAAPQGASAPQPMQPPQPQGAPSMQAPMPPAAGSPPGAPVQPVAQQTATPDLRTLIQQAMQNGELDPAIAQQALAMLDQGMSEQQVYEWLQQQLQQAQQTAQGQMAQIPPDITLEQALSILQQSGAPQEAIQQLQALVQNGTPVAQALQQVVLQYSGVAS